MRLRLPRGFTLIEMMVVVAIIAILAMVAMPSFHERIARAQVAEALPLADFAKQPVQVAWAASQPMPADNAAAGLPASNLIVSEFVQSVELHNGALHVTFGNNANGALRGKVVSLRPAVVESARIVPITWVCGQASPPAQMTPQGDNRTDLPARYLPQRCRAR